MAFCRNCGKEIDDKAVICVHCGVSTELLKNNTENYVKEMTFKEESEKIKIDPVLKTGSFIHIISTISYGLALILGIFVSWILYWIFLIPFLLYGIITYQRGYKKNAILTIFVCIAAGMVVRLLGIFMLNLLYG